MVKYFEVEGKIVKLVDDNVTATFSCHVFIDRYNIVDEDGIFDGKEVHKGDVIATLYVGNPNKAEYVIFDKDTSIAKKAAKIKEERIEKRAKDAQPMIADEAI